MAPTNDINGPTTIQNSPTSWEYEKITIDRSPKGLGFTVAGGVDNPHYKNDNSIYVTRLIPNGPAHQDGRLELDDIIVRVNDTELTDAKHSEAVLALKSSGPRVQLLIKRKKSNSIVNYNNNVNSNTNNSSSNNLSKKRSFYARTLFNYDPTKDSGLPSKGLSFKFGDILHITNASDDDWWQAKRVLDNGQDETAHGIVPSKKRIEKRERAKLRSVKFTNRNSSESTLDRRKRFIFSKRFPFMKSRENVGIMSYSSTTSINNNNHNDEAILSYEPVLLQNINYTRPVALYGPVKDEIEGLREDLSCDDRFFKMESIVPYTTRPPKEGEIDGVKYHFVSIQEMKRDLANHKFVEAGELNHHLYGTSIDSIREVAESGKHCLLNISPKAIKRLHDAKIYPIAIFIKPKSVESLLEMNKRWSEEEAVAAMDYADRLEHEFGTYFTSTIRQDSPNEVLREIINVIAEQSGSRIWIPTTFEAVGLRDRGVKSTGKNNLQM